MKEVKVIHINDGTSEVLTNGNRHYAEDNVWAGKMLSMYLNAGYEISQIIPDFTPGEPGGGGYAFYKTGFTVFLVRDVQEGDIEITIEDWEENNTEEFMSQYYYEDDEYDEYDEEEPYGEFDFSDDEDLFDFGLEEDFEI